MATAERPALREQTLPANDLTRRWAWSGLAIVLAAGLGLRLWGVRQGLPYAYNADEADHFVPHAIEMFVHGTLNPKYFANPPAFTYVLHGLFAVWYGGASGAVHAYRHDPAALYTLARVAAAVLGTIALWLLYLTGARLWGRAVGLLAAAIEAVAFLPVFYAHLALNDAPTLAPATLSLLGTAGALRKGRVRDYLLAGIGLGLACATKYTAGIVLVPLLAAIAMRCLDGGAKAARRAIGGLAVAGLLALVAFLIANPYALLDYKSFHAELVHQSTLSGESQGKLGAPKEGGLVYYLWSFTWGLGWAPSIAALGGAICVWRRERALGWLLVPAALLFLAFMGTEGRYFGRWLMPIFPIVCLLAAFFVAQVLSWAVREQGAGARRAALAALLVAGVLVQGLVYSIHSGIVLSRVDTRNLTRSWMLEHIPAGAKVVAEPVEPEEWAREVRPGTSTAANPLRWQLYPALFRHRTACLDHQLTGAQIVARVPDVVSRCCRRQNLHAGAARNCPLHRHHRVGALGHRRAGRDRNRLTPSQLPPSRMACARLVDDPKAHRSMRPRLAHVRAAHREPVHRRVVKRRDRVRTGDVRRQYPPQRRT